MNSLITFQKYASELQIPWAVSQRIVKESQTRSSDISLGSFVTLNMQKLGFLHYSAVNLMGSLSPLCIANLLFTECEMDGLDGGRDT